MGTYLSKPITEKETEKGRSAQFEYAATAMQGWRSHQEDAHNCITDLTNGWSLFAVYDGHGGPEVSRYAAEELPTFLKESKFEEDEKEKEVLEELFIKFDGHLKAPDVVKRLKTISATARSNRREDVDGDGPKPLAQMLKRYGVKLVKGTDADDVESEDNESGNDLNDSASDVEKGEAGDDAVKEEETGEEVKKEENQVKTEGDDEEKKPQKRPNDDPIDTEAKRHKENGTDESKLNGKSDEPKEEVEKEKPAEGSQQKGNGVVDEKKEEEAEEQHLCETHQMLHDHHIKHHHRDHHLHHHHHHHDENHEEGDEEDDEEEEEEDDEDDYDTVMTYGDLHGGNDIPGEDSGTTACVCLVSNDKIIVANIGDSRAVLCRNGDAIDLSVDHKPEDDIETARIKKAGGRVTEEGRVNGGLNLSRAFGDHFYKKNAALPLKEQMISALPDVRSFDLTVLDSFLLVACDGIWNSLESQQAIDYVKQRLAQKEKPEKIVEELCEACLARDTTGDGTGCDNMTVILIVFNHGQPAPFELQAEEQQPEIGTEAGEIAVVPTEHAHE